MSYGAPTVGITGFGTGINTYYEAQAVNVARGSSGFTALIALQTLIPYDVDAQVLAGHSVAGVRGWNIERLADSGLGVQYACNIEQAALTLVGTISPSNAFGRTVLVGLTVDDSGFLARMYVNGGLVAAGSYGAAFLQGTDFFGLGNIGEGALGAQDRIIAFGYKDQVATAVQMAELWNRFRETSSLRAAGAVLSSFGYSYEASDISAPPDLSPPAAWRNGGTSSAGALAWQGPTTPIAGFFSTDRDPASSSASASGVGPDDNAVTNVYLSGLNGDDANDGLTPATAVATYARVWQLLPAIVYQPFVVHIGAHGGAGYVYELPPEDRVFAEGAYIVLYGDGAGQPGEDGFTVVESGVAGAATTATVLELASAPATEAYVGYTAEYTSGAAAGYRRMIRDNVAAVATLVAGTENVTNVLTPLPGDTYRVIRPAGVLQLPVTGTIGRSPPVLGTELSNTVPVHVINLRLESAAAGLQLPSDAPAWFFGVELQTSLRLLLTEQRVCFAGTDALVANTALLRAVDPLHASAAWNGWGLSQPGAVRDGTGSMLTTRTGSRFTGFVCGGTILSFGRDIIFGGFFGTFRVAGECFVGPGGGVFSVTSAGVRTVASAASSLCASVTGILELAAGGSSTVNVALEVRVTINTANGVSLWVLLGGLIRGNAVFSVESPISLGVGVQVSAGGAIALENPTGVSQLAINIPLGTGILCIDGGSCSLPGWQSLIAAEGVVVGDTGRFFLGVGGIQTGGAPITASSFAVSVEGGSFVFGAKDTVWTGSNAAGGALRVLRGGLFEQREAYTGYGTRTGTPGTLTVTNTALGANADGIEVSGGSKAYLRGAANTLVNANGYGIDARFGGQVYCGAQPSSVVGATADLIVDTAIGGQPDTALAASESAIAFQTGGLAAFNGSIIARST